MCTIKQARCSVDRPPPFAEQSVLVDFESHVRVAMPHNLCHALYICTVRQGRSETAENDAARKLDQAKQDAASAKEDVVDAPRRSRILLRRGLRAIPTHSPRKPGCSGKYSEHQP